MTRIHDNLLLGLAFIVAMSVSFLSISSQSLWIDEANSALKAIQPTLALFWSENLRIAGSDLQMPLYMLFLWGWEKLVGSSEYALRAFNIPLFLISILVCLLLLKTSIQRRILLVGSFCLSPMLWVYMDEARPYVMQFSGATLCLVSLYNIAHLPRSTTLDLGTMAAGAVILCGSSLTGVIFTFWFGLAFLALWMQSHRLSEFFIQPKNLIIAILAGVLLAGFGLYYLWTLQQHARASSVGKTSLATAAFCLYELLGATGLGPGRLELRSQGAAALKDFAVQLGGYFLILCAFILAAIVSFRKHVQPSREGIVIFASGFFACLSMVFIGILSDFRVLGRHLLPILPFILFAMSWACVALWTSKKRHNRIVVVVLWLFLATSSFAVRLDSRFAKDDYRSAAAAACRVLDRGGVVWWAADPSAATYYGIPSAPEVVHVVGSSASELDALPRPEIVLLSKKDIYDAGGQLANWLQRNHYKETSSLTAFCLFTP